MDFNDTPDQAKFRAKCREWLEANAELKESKSSGHSDSSLEDHLKVAKAWQQKKIRCRMGNAALAKRIWGH
jgi:hypothetical protein